MIRVPPNQRRWPKVPATRGPAFRFALLGMVVELPPSAGRVVPLAGSATCLAAPATRLPPPFSPSLPRLPPQRLELDRDAEERRDGHPVARAATRSNPARSRKDLAPPHGRGVARCAVSTANEPVEAIAASRLVPRDMPPPTADRRGRGGWPPGRVRAHGATTALAPAFPRWRAAGPFRSGAEPRHLVSGKGQSVERWGDGARRRVRHRTTTGRTARRPGQSSPG